MSGWSLHERSHSYTRSLDLSLFVFIHTVIYFFTTLVRRKRRGRRRGWS
jgi:hypothetical protein